VPPGGVALRLSFAYFGDPQDGPRQVAPVLDMAPPQATAGRVISYPELQALGDHSEPAGHRYYTKSSYLGDLPERAAAAMLDSAAEMPSELSSIDFEYLRGAITGRPGHDSAFPNRDAPYIVTASAQWTDPARDEENATWASHSIQRLRAFRIPGAYVNYVQDAEWAPPEIYGTQRLQRLAAVKRRYDPDNVLRGGLTLVAERATSSSPEGNPL
jgi:Berberine and berberine like